MPRRYRQRKPNTRTYKRLKKAYRSGGMWGLAKKAATGVVKYYLNPEYKFLETANVQTPSNTGIIHGISLITQGDGSTNRDGNELKVTSALVRATLAKNATATATHVRVIVFSDVSSAGVIPLVTDILQTASPLSPINRVNGTRFTVLMDRSYILDNDKPLKQLYWYKKMQHHIHYLDATNNIASLGQGQLYLLTVSNEATNTPTVSYNSRMRFLDN